MNVKLTATDGLVSAKPTLLQRYKFNRLANNGLTPIELAAELPESIGREIAAKLFGVNTQGRPVVLTLSTSSATKVTTGVLV
jgi:hypothetical protein